MTVHVASGSIASRLFALLAGQASHADVHDEINWRLQRYGFGFDSLSQTLISVTCPTISSAGVFGPADGWRRFHIICADAFAGFMINRDELLHFAGEADTSHVDVVAKCTKE